MYCLPSNPSFGEVCEIIFKISIKLPMLFLFQFSTTCIIFLTLWKGHVFVCITTRCFFMILMINKILSRSARFYGLRFWNCVLNICKLVCSGLIGTWFIQFAHTFVTFDFWISEQRTIIFIFSYETITYWFYNQDKILTMRYDLNF